MIRRVLLALTGKKDTPSSEGVFLCIARCKAQQEA